MKAELMWGSCCVVKQDQCVWASIMHDPGNNQSSSLMYPVGCHPGHWVIIASHVCKRAVACPCHAYVTPLRRCCPAMQQPVRLRYTAAPCNAMSTCHARPASTPRIACPGVPPDPEVPVLLLCHPSLLFRHQCRLSRHGRRLTPPMSLLFTTCPPGVIMSLTITTIAACETAIGLALCVTYFHIRSTTDVEALNLLK